MSTPKTAQVLRAEVAQLLIDLEITRKELALIESVCLHEWGDEVYVPLRVPDYTNYNLSVSKIPDPILYKIENHWKRTCNLCGKVEDTQKFYEEKKRLPQWVT